MIFEVENVDDVVCSVVVRVPNFADTSQFAWGSEIELGSCFS